MFVYGTLQDERVRAAVIGAATAHVAGRGSVRGALYDLGTYPALVETTTAARVPGTLLVLHAAAALAKLDVYEGVRDGLYVRRCMVVGLDTGAEVDAWGYLYARSVSGHRRIAAWPVSRVSNNAAGTSR